MVGSFDFGLVILRPRARSRYTQLWWEPPKQRPSHTDTRTYLLERGEVVDVHHQPLLLPLLRPIPVCRRPGVSSAGGGGGGHQDVEAKHLFICLVVWTCVVVWVRVVLC